MRSGHGIFWASEFLLSPLSMVYFTYVSDQHSYSEPGVVSTQRGDCLQAGKPPQ